ncbi:hypothetical protein RSOLAG22IIIB_05692 [Rhizoctonia solani]|uniref:Uncharacterized protein n=1 Tax=Rhizoctonia solani TaxID=456999 RepID=A0A0K6G7Y9_9AGAM|nr:hypothetical protein RSOLAG22IIIB_05692 [Rhizoctonia solani]
MRGDQGLRAGRSREICQPGARSPPDCLGVVFVSMLHTSNLTGGLFPSPPSRFTTPPHTNPEHRDCSKSQRFRQYLREAIWDCGLVDLARSASPTPALLPTARESFL